MRTPSHATVVAYAALIVAATGTAYAATELPRGSVGTPQLRRGAVTDAKVRAGSLTGRVFAPGTLRRGPAGPAGARGPVGPAGPSRAYQATQAPVAVPIVAGADAVLTSIPVPAGSYVVDAGAWLATEATAGQRDTMTCSVSDGTALVNAGTQFPVPASAICDNAGHHVFTATLTVSAAGTVALSCRLFPLDADPADTVSALFGRLVLVRVDGITRPA